MTRYDLISQPVVETSNVASSYMFATSPQAHLYGGPFIPPGYQSLYGTFSSATSSHWTSPMSSILEIPSGTSIMNATYPAPSPSPTPIVEKQVEPYVSGQGYLQQPNSPYVGCPPYGLQLTPSSPPPMGGGIPIVGIPQIGNQIYYNPPYPSMATNDWQPTFPVQTGSFWD